MYFFSILSILFFLYSFIQSSELCEQNTSTTSDEVQYTTQKSINVDDISGHVIRIFKTETNHKNSNKNCEGLTLVKTDFFGISDYINKNGRVTGYSIATYSDGSKIFSTLTGNAETPKDQAKNGYVVSTITITGVQIVIKVFMVLEKVKLSLIQKLVTPLVQLTYSTV